MSVSETILKLRHAANEMKSARLRYEALLIRERFGVGTRVVVTSCRGQWAGTIAHRCEPEDGEMCVRPDLWDQIGTPKESHSRNGFIVSVHDMDLWTPSFEAKTDEVVIDREAFMRP